MSLREAEAQSIRAFVQSAADEGYLSGRVLDYGCGKQPYRGIVEAAGGTYYGFDLSYFPASLVEEDVNPHLEGVRTTASVSQTILCTQVLQYVPFPSLLLRRFHEDAYALVLTYPTNWPEVEPEDLHRFTKAGMERLLTEAGFEIIRHDFRHGFQHEGVSFTVGYGVIARA